MVPTTVSPLRYPGGKSKFYLYVKELLSYNDMLDETYIEPFAGGAGLALKLLLNHDVRRIVINDLDPAIYSFWNSILYNTDRFCELIDTIPLSQNEWHNQRNTYLKQDLSDPLGLGFSTFYLNRTNVSGVVKGGMIGGQKQNGNYGLGARFNRQGLIAKIQKISEFKEHIILLNLDAKELLQPSTLRKYYKVFLNLDPPYVKKGAQLYKNAFNEADHRELFQLIKQCNRKWIVTYDVCPLIDDLYKDYRSSFLDVSYSVNGVRTAKEYIFFSNNLTLPNSISLRVKDNTLKNDS